MNKILVIQTAFLGDVILATGIIEKLHSFYPKSHIHFLVRKGNEDLITGHPFIEQIWIWDKKQKKVKNLFRLIRQVRKERFNVVVNLHRFASSGLITALSGAQMTIGFKKNPLSILFTKKLPHKIDGKTHEIQRNHSLISHITDDEPSKPKLFPSREDESTVGKLISHHFVTISPASVWFTKALPIQKWHDLISQIPLDYNILLLGSSQDQELCDALIKISERKNMRNLAGNLSLLQSAALMSKAIMNYTNDSAPLHLASAVNAPVTAVFCSTIPGFGFGPLSDHSHVLESRVELSCRPCGLHGKKECPLGHFKCATTIEMNHYE